MKESMKKIVTLLIILIIIIVGFLSGCNKTDLKKEEEQEENQEEEKYSEFVEWVNETNNWLDIKYIQLEDSIPEENWDDCLFYCNQVRNTLDFYISECRDFYVLGTLDLARDEYVDYLTILDDAYIHYEFAFENYEIGFISNGNEHWEIGEEYHYQANQHKTNCSQYIRDWYEED